MTTQRHNRLARWVFRLGVAVCVLIVVVSIVSFRRSLNVAAAKGVVGFSNGSAVVIFDKRIVSGVRVLRVSPVSLHLLLWTRKWNQPGPAGSVVTIRSYPLWMPLLAALIPTVLAWRRLRRPLPGHCRKCGYDLTGNVTGKCSECGTELMENEK